MLIYLRFQTADAVKRQVNERIFSPIFRMPDHLAEIFHERCSNCNRQTEFFTIGFHTLGLDIHRGLGLDRNNIACSLIKEIHLCFPTGRGPVMRQLSYGCNDLLLNELFSQSAFEILKNPCSVQRCPELKPCLGRKQSDIKHDLLESTIMMCVQREIRLRHSVHLPYQA